MKNVLITGASRGVGYALATKFLSENHRVFCASRNLKPLLELKGQYKDLCHLVPLDLQNTSSINHSVKNIKDIVNEVDIVVHNAGALVNKPFLDITPEELLMCYNVNVLGPFNLTQRIQPILRKNAHIVVISSMGGFQGTQKFPGLTAYSSSKAAAASLVECLQEEFKDSALAFNCLCLGAVQTEMLEEAFPGYQAPLNPDEMSMYIYQFCMDANRYLKGKIIPVSLTTP